MSTVGRIASVVTAAGVIGVGYWIGNQDSSATTGVVASPSTPSASPTAPSTTATTPTSAASPSATASSSAAAGNGTFTGSTESDRYGALTVTVTKKSGKISDITYTSTASDGRSQEIEAQAIPTLKAEAIAADSADIATVSGATYISDKYKTSLQSALDKA